MRCSEHQQTLNCGSNLQVVLSHRVLSMGDCAEFLLAFFAEGS